MTDVTDVALSATTDAYALKDISQGQSINAPMQSADTTLLPRWTGLQIFLYANHGKVMVITTETHHSGASVATVSTRQKQLG